jgi:hypothetical protein
MFRLFLLSIVVVPVLLGILSARVRSRQLAWVTFVSFVLVYHVVYLAVLYYLRLRWIG